MEKLNVVKIDGESIEFSNGAKLYSDHQSDCCEHHYLGLSDLTLQDFEGLEFNLSDDAFFKRIEDYGIELIPIAGHSVKIPGYGSNNGYYSSNLSLVIETENGVKTSYDISECQVIND